MGIKMLSLGFAQLAKRWLSKKCKELPCEREYSHLALHKQQQEGQGVQGITMWKGVMMSIGVS